jgi:tetratricopeptide (TPR) repeat protein
LITLSIEDNTGDNYVILTDYLPSGAVVLKDTIRGSFGSAQIEAGKVVFYFAPNTYISRIQYRIAGYCPGTYRVLPPVLVNALNPQDMAVGKVSAFSLLVRGEKAAQPYQMNKDELYNLGMAYFNDGLYRDALTLLEKLYTEDEKYGQPELARMLLWIRSEEEFYDAGKLVEYFEILKEKYPDLFIPFERILTIGRAYNDIGEYERSYIVYRATVEASFLKDAPIGGTLEQGGEFYGSVGFMYGLWQEYPDSAQVVSTYFTMAQEIYNNASRAAELKSRLAEAEEGKPKEYTKEDFLNAAEGILWRFMALYARNPLADDAAFTMVNLSLDKKVYTHAVELCRRYRDLYPKSDFLTSFQYMEALGLFSLRRYAEAIKAAGVVAEGRSDDRDLATYILAQIYHTQHKPEQAVSYYSRVADKYPDAREAISYFEKKAIYMDEVASFKPGQKAELALTCRNINHVYFQVYKVDLMKLYLKEKNLSRITTINLSGIAPIISKDISLGRKSRYEEYTENISLNLSEEGAYLVICRGDDLFTSGLVLITPLSIEVQEDPQSGRVRVNVKNLASNEYADNVHVKVIGSDNSSFVSGETDLRGIFIADGIAGAATVIVRSGKDRYAFYRGVSYLSGGEAGYYEENVEQQKLNDDEYRLNLDQKQTKMRNENRENLDKIYKDQRSGVQIQEAY